MTEQPSWPARTPHSPGIWRRRAPRVPTTRPWSPDGLHTQSSAPTATGPSRLPLRAAWRPPSRSAPTRRLTSPRLW